MMFKNDKPEQVLQIEPANELRFTGPFTSAVTSYITLKNPSEKKVCYKIKTTAPKQYCVRPNSGTLDAMSSVEIAVSLQPQQGEFPGSENYKHKFVVQTMFAPDGEYDADQLWKEITPERLMDSELKCVFSGGSEIPASQDCVKEVPVQENEFNKKVGTQTFDADRPKLTKKNKFKELYNVNLDTIGHAGVHRVILRRKTVLPVPQSCKTTSKQEKPAALSASVATQENKRAKNEVESRDLVRKGPASLPKKSPETKNVLKPKPEHNSLFPPVEVPSTAAGRRKLLSELTKKRDVEMTKLLDLCASELNNPQQ